MLIEWESHRGERAMRIEPLPAACAAAALVVTREETVPVFSSHGRAWETTCPPLIPQTPVGSFTTACNSLPDYQLGHPVTASLPAQGQDHVEAHERLQDVALRTAAAPDPLEHFAENLVVHLRTPLADALPRRSRASTKPATEAPKRRSSSRLANDKMAKFPAAKRGDNAVSTDAKCSYDQIYRDGLKQDHVEAINELCPSLETAVGRSRPIPV